MTLDSCATAGRSMYDQEVDLARRLLAQGERQHALHHCVNALGLAPQRHEWRAPLRELMTAPAAVEELQATNFFGAFAARAFHRHDTGDLAEAMSMISQVHATMPHLGFSLWFGAWAEEAEAAQIPTDPDSVIRVLMAAATMGVGRIRLLPSERACAEQMVPIVHLVLRLHPHDVRIALLSSAILRRATRYDEALSVVEQPADAESVESVLIARGLALRGGQHFDAALAAFDVALATSQDPVYHLERFRVLADAGRWEAALEAWAQFEASSSSGHENEPERAVVVKAAQECLGPPEEPPLDLARRRLLGHGQLRPMLDATAKLLRDVGQRDEIRAKGPVGGGTTIRAGRVKVIAQGNESASNRLCAALMLAGAPDPRQAAYSVTGDAMRTRSIEVDGFRLWRQEDGVVVQALDPPPVEVSEWIERLALRDLDGTVPETSFDSSLDFLDLWSAAISPPPPAATARDWVAATVFPRMPLCRVCAGPDWMFRWQVVALLGLACSESRWDASQKRLALCSLLRGALDWPLAAAIRVGAEVALQDPDALAELRQLLLDLADGLQDEPNAAITETLLDALEMLPLVPQASINKLRATLEGHDESPADKPATALPKATSETRRRPWWKFWGST